MLKNIKQLRQSKSTSNAGADSSSNTPSTPPSITDPVDKRRALAAASHNDASVLLNMAQSDSSEAVREACARRYASLIEDNESTRQTLSALAESKNTKPLFLTIAAQSNESSLRKLCLDKSDSDDDLLIVAEKTKFHDTRLEAANRLESHANIDRCWRNLKTKDKLVARELKLKLDQQREKNDLAESQTLQAEKILDALDKIANSVWQPGTLNRLELYISQWKNLEFEPSPEQQQRYTALYSATDQKAISYRKVHDQEKQRESIVQTLETIKQSLVKASAKDLPALLPVQNNAFRENQEQWKALEQTSTEPDNLTQQQLELSNTIKSVLKNAGTVSKAQQLIDGSNSDSKTLNKQLRALETLKTDQSNCEFQTSVPRLIETLQTKVKQQTAADTELKQQIHRQLASLNSAVSAKRWGPAKSIHERLAKKIDRLPGSEKTSYKEKLARLEVKVKELGDWKEFASEPKLVTLCEQMEKLPSQKLAPNDCANRIKELQTQWKAMGASPAQEKHWPRFKQASDTAYEPCGKYFTARREDRKNKLDKRKEICELLERYESETDWSQPDWKLVEKTIRTAKREWKTHQVFDKKRGKSLDDRFTRILQSIDEKLAPVYDANAAEKSELIAKVVKLGEGEINQHCINQVKSLQSAWRLSGSCRQKDDRALWKEFSQVTNKVFDEYHGKRREQQAASVAHVKRAREIINTLASVKKSTEPVNEKQLTELQTEYAALAEFPERDQKKLARDYQRALDSVDQHRQKALDQNRNRALQSLQHNADLCQQLESLAGQNAEKSAEESVEDLGGQIETILADWQESKSGDHPQAGKALNARRQSILDLLKANETPDYEKNNDQRRLICIELEILCDRETPAEDKSRRMQYQLDQLQKGLSSNSTSLSQTEQIEQLQIKWLTAAPASPDIKDKLESRFQQALK